MVIPSESYASYVVPIKWHLVQLLPFVFLPQAHSAAIDCLATFANGPPEFLNSTDIKYKYKQKTPQ